MGEGVKKAFEKIGDGVGLEEVYGKEEWERKEEEKKKNWGY